MTAMPGLASLRRRLACLLYELILLGAVLFLAGFAVSGFVQTPLEGGVRTLFQVYLCLVTGFYFTSFWARGGQTLAMKTWHIRLVTADGQPLSFARAWGRYGLALASLGYGLLWAGFDHERQFLHDRLAGTRLIRSDALGAPKPVQGNDGEKDEDQPGR